MPIFMKLQGIDGESTVAGHEGEIDVLSLAWGVTNASSGATGGGAGTGRASFQDLHFQTTLSKAGPNLMLACATGRHLASAVLTFTRGGSSPFTYLVIRLTDCLITWYESAVGEDAAPTDDVGLTFSTIDMTYTVQNADGSAGETVETLFDLR